MKIIYEAVSTLSIYEEKLPVKVPDADCFQAEIIHDSNKGKRGGGIGKGKTKLKKQQDSPSKKGINSSLALSGPRAAAMTVNFLQALTRNWTSSCLSWSISAATDERSSSSFWSTSETSMAVESGTGDLSSSIYSVGVIGVESTSICCIVLDKEWR